MNTCLPTYLPTYPPTYLPVFVWVLFSFFSSLVTGAHSSLALAWLAWLGIWRWELGVGEKGFHLVGWWIELGLL